MTTTSDRPTEITAGQWDTVAEDVRLKRCEVKDEMGNIVTNISPSEFVAYYESKEHVWISDDSGYVYTVTWLATPAPSVPPAPAAEAGIDIQKLVQTIEIGLRPDASRSQYAANTLGQLLEHEREDSALFLQSLANRDQDVSHLEADNESLRSQLAASEERGRGLRIALEQIASKSDAERPKKWENEQDTSYGVTIGLWRAGVIARAALATGGGSADGGGS